MLRAAAAAALCLPALLCGPASARAAPPRAVLAFLPVASSDGATEATLERLHRRPGLALGLLSAAQGRYAAEQVLLDVSQGARTSLSLYAPADPPPVALATRGNRGSLSGWSAVVRRADQAPGDLRPGLLAGAIPGGAAYAGVTGRPQGVAVAAADRQGLVDAVSLGSEATLAPRARDLLADHRLVVVGLPAGRRGGATLDAVLRARAPADLVLVVRAPPKIAASLLPAGAAGLGPGLLRSSTTRQAGIAAPVDLGPTILRRLGLPVPRPMQGEPMTAVRGRSAGDLTGLSRRLRALSTSRFSVLAALLVGWVALVLALGAVTGRVGVRRGARWGGLAALWLPSVLLLTAALAPSRTVETLIVAVGCLLLGALTDVLVPWPRGPAVPAAAGLLAYTVDLAFGSELIVRSLLGPNPSVGARFYGIGNELEAVLPILLFVGLAALPVTRTKSLRGALVFALSGLALGVVVGAGRLGADVGGVITVGAGAAAATLLMLPGGVSRRALAIAVGVPIAAVLVLAVVDLVTGGDSHFARTILQAGSAESVGEAIGRRYQLAFALLQRGLIPLLVVLALLSVAYGALRRRDLFAPVVGHAGWRAALGGSLVACVVGALVNDGGPVLLVFGVILLALMTAYIQGDDTLRR